MADYVYGSGVPYGQYLQENAYVRDITGHIKKSGEATRNQISAQTRDIVVSNETLSKKFGVGFDAVNGTLEMGFDRVENALTNVESSIESLHSDFDYNMGLVLDQLQIQNQLTFGILEKLDAIHKTLETPRLTQARECYNIGCERLSKGLLDKALEAFLKAEERNDTDFFTEFQIGKLYLYGVDEDDNVIDPIKAEHHLRNAARYGKAEIIEFPEFRKWTGEALLHASIAYYAQANDHQINGNTAKAKEFIIQAFKHAQQACEIFPSLSESQYHLAKYAALIGDEEISLHSLEKAVTADVNYCLKIEFDRDFDDMRPQVFDLFERLRVNMSEIARRRLLSSQQNITDVSYLISKTTKGIEMDNLLSSADKKISANTLVDINEALQIFDLIDLNITELAPLKNVHNMAQKKVCRAGDFLKELEKINAKDIVPEIYSQIHLKFIEVNNNLNSGKYDLICKSEGLAKEVIDDVGKAGEMVRLKQTNLRCDGLYVSKKIGDGTRDYLRFYEDGTVLAVGSSGKAHEVIRWFNRSHRGGHGLYSIVGSNIKFTAKHENGTIDYEGTIEKDGLRLKKYSHINGYSDKLNYKFENVREGYEQNTKLSFLDKLRGK